MIKRLYLKIFADLSLFEEFGVHVPRARFLLESSEPRSGSDHLVEDGEFRSSHPLSFFLAPAVFRLPGRPEAAFLRGRFPWARSHEEVVEPLLVGRQSVRLLRGPLRVGCGRSFPLSGRRGRALMIFLLPRELEVIAASMGVSSQGLPAGAPPSRGSGGARVVVLPPRGWEVDASSMGDSPRGFPARAPPSRGSDGARSAVLPPWGLGGDRTTFGVVAPLERGSTDAFTVVFFLLHHENGAGNSTLINFPAHPSLPDDGRDIS